jgi:limonene 1,2-monooxygenase
MISPSGMTLAGKYGAGALSMGSMSTAGLQSLPLQWSFAKDSAEKHGKSVDRSNWRIVMNFHIAETREQAREEAKHGLMKWHNEYTVGTLMRPGAEIFDSPDEAVDGMAFGDNAAIVIGTPDDLVDSIRKMYELTGGFGTVIGFVHDWCTPEQNFRSWDRVARYVVPEINGYLKAYRKSQQDVIENREVFDRAGEAVTSKIMENEKAVKALAEEANAGSAMQSPNAPDLKKMKN